MRTFNFDTTPLSVRDNALLWNNKPIAEFPTAICELARVDEQILVVVDGDIDPPDMEYAGSNLWCVNLSGNLLWKAPQLNNRFDEYKIYLKPHPYSKFVGEHYYDVRLACADDCLAAFTYDDRGYTLFINVSDGKRVASPEHTYLDNPLKYSAFQKVRRARGANLRRTPVEWPDAFLQSMKASEVLQVALKMTRSEMDEQIVAIINGFKNVDRTPAPYDPVNQIRLSFDRYCENRMNAFWGQKYSPVRSRDLPKLVDRFLAEIGVEIAPRSAFYRWP